MIPRKSRNKYYGRAWTKKKQKRCRYRYIYYFGHQLFKSITVNCFPTICYLNSDNYENFRTRWNVYGIFNVEVRALINNCYNPQWRVVGFTLLFLINDRETYSSFGLISRRNKYDGRYVPLTYHVWLSVFKRLVVLFVRRRSELTVRSK